MCDKFLRAARGRRHVARTRHSRTPPQHVSQHHQHGLCGRANKLASHALPAHPPRAAGGYETKTATCQPVPWLRRVRVW